MYCVLCTVVIYNRDNVTMLKCYNVTMLQCYNATMIQCYKLIICVDDDDDDDDDDCRVDVGGRFDGS